MEEKERKGRGGKRRNGKEVKGNFIKAKNVLGKERK